MTNQSSLRSIIRVGVGARKAQCGIPRISSGSVPCCKSRDLSLSRSTSCLRSSVSTAHIGKLIADTVGDNVGVESFFLALVDNRIDGLEGVFGGSTTVKTGLELDGWDALAKIKTRDRAGNKAREDATVQGISTVKIQVMRGETYITASEEAARAAPLAAAADPATVPDAATEADAEATAADVEAVDLIMILVSVHVLAGYHDAKI